MTDDAAKRLRAGIERLVRVYLGYPDQLVGCEDRPDAGFVSVTAAYGDATTPPELPPIKHLALNVLLGLDTPPGVLIDALVEIGVLTGEWEKMIREDEREKCARVADLKQQDFRAANCFPEAVGCGKVAKWIRRMT